MSEPTATAARRSTARSTSMAGGSTAGWTEARTGSAEGLTQRRRRRSCDRVMATAVPSARVGGERMTVEEVAAGTCARGAPWAQALHAREHRERDARASRAVLPRQDARRDRHEDVVDLLAVLEGKGLSPKSIRNVIATLSALFNFARAPQRRWASANPCEGLELPAVPERTEIRFLTLEEVRALVANVPPGMYEQLDRVMFLAAAMTGLRKGELVALRWRDVDWTAQRVRVRQNFTRGEFGTPKSQALDAERAARRRVGGRTRPALSRPRGGRATGI